MGVASGPGNFSWEVGNYAHVKRSHQIPEDTLSMYHIIIKVRRKHQYFIGGFGSTGCIATLWYVFIGM